MKQSRSAVREALLGALLAGCSITDAAKLAKVSRSTAHRIAGEPGFRADLDSRLLSKRQPFEAALADAMGRAVQTLRLLLDAKSESIRLKAATVLLAPRQYPTPPSPPQTGQSGEPKISAESRERLGRAIELRIQQRLRMQGWAPPGELPRPMRKSPEPQPVVP